MSTREAGATLPGDAELAPRRGSGWAALAIVVALLVPVASFSVISPLVTAMPTWDQWSMGPVWAAHFGGQPVLPLLLAPYNGHRNVLPRMFFYGLGVLSDWNLHLEVVASYLASFVTMSLLLLMARRQPRLAGWLAVPIAAQVFSLLQYENYISGYPFGQNLSQLLATIAIFLLSRPDSPARPGLGTSAFAGAALAAVGATFSWGAGLACFPVGLLALLLRGERRPSRLGTWLLLTGAATAVVKASAANGPFQAVPWRQLPQFYLTLLGKAWSPLPMPALALCTALGAGALATFSVLAVWAYRRVGRASFPWFVLGLYSLAAGGLISIGRTGDGQVQALASHYVTATYPLVVSCAALSLMILLSLAAEDTRRRAAYRWAALVVVAGFSLQPAIASAKMLPMLRDWNPIVSRNALAIARGTATDEQIRASHHPDPQTVRDATEVLRAHRLAWFRQALDGETPTGSVDRLAGLPAGSPRFSTVAGTPWIIEGWAVRGRHQGGPVRAVELFVDGRRRAAAASLDLPRHDVAEYFHSSGFLDSGWSMAVPADAVTPGTHRIWVVATDFAGGLHPLLDTDLEVVAATAPAQVEEPALAATTQ